jgi:FkbM family methyltransferase
MMVLNKWRFLVIKFVHRYLIRLGVYDDYWVRISDDRLFDKEFGMHSCQFTDQIACNILKFGWQAYEPPMGRLIFNLANNLPLTFLDVGANTGFYSLLASASGAKKVFAFEPVPAIFKILSSNVISSGLDVNLYQEAIANQPGQMSMYLPKSDCKYIETSASLNPDFRDEHVKTVAIQVRSLDELAKEFFADGAGYQDIFLIKIDVESHELPVLKGGKHFFERIRPVIIIELLEENKDRQEIYSVISAYGYVAYTLSINNSLEQLKSLNVASASDNYLFVPHEKINLINDALVLRGGMTILA